jgi:voltage-gated potassium channel
MIKVILAALGLTAVTVIIHGAGAASAARRAVRSWGGRRDRTGRLGAELLLAQLVSLLLLLHLAEAVVWALFFVLVGALPDLETAAYFSLTSYTTVGYGDVVLPEPWRLLGPLEAAVGILMLGWSTGVLVAVIGMIYRQLYPTLTGRAEPPARDAG